MSSASMSVAHLYCLATGLALLHHVPLSPFQIVAKVVLRTSASSPPRFAWCRSVLLPVLHRLCLRLVPALAADAGSERRCGELVFEVGAASPAIISSLLSEACAFSSRAFSSNALADSKA